MKKGFTLFEMLLSMSLITGMLGVVLVNYRQANNKRTIQVAVDKFRQTVDTAKSNAMNGKKDCTICGGTDYKCNNSVDDKPLEGWAVSMTTNSYSLFGVCGTSKFPAVIPTVALPPGISITASTALPSVGTLGVLGPALEFKPAGQGTNLTTGTTFTVAGTGGSGQVSVTNNAQISSTALVTPPVTTPEPTLVPTTAPTLIPTQTPYPTTVPTSTPTPCLGNSVICSTNPGGCCLGYVCKLGTGGKLRCLP